MRTFKRKIVDIDTSVNNISKYNNQLTFTGIKQSKNIYEVDQKSQMDTLNVYVNDENTLVSREPLVEDTIDIELDGELIDIKETNGVKVYVTKNEDIYKIIANKNDETTIIDNVSKYYISIFDQYIICWNNLGAMAIDTNSVIEWTLLENFIEPPVTKITTGGSVENFDKNEFSESYKEQYVRDNKAETLLPIDDNAEISGEIVTNTAIYTLSDLELKNTHLKYQILKPLNVPISQESQVSLAFTDNGLRIIAIASNEYIYLSYDGGSTFIAVALPGGRHYGFRVKSLTDDGKGLFYLDPSDGVYYLNLSTLEWTLYKVNNTESGFTGTVIGYHFLNSENFCFITKDENSQLRLYYKGINMNYNGAINKFESWNDSQNIFETYQSGYNYLPRMCKIAVDSITQRAVVMLWLKESDSDDGSLLTFIGRPRTQEADTAYELIERTDIGYRTIENMKLENSILTIEGISYKSNTNYYKYVIKLTVNESDSIINSDTSEYLTNCPSFEQTPRNIYWTFPFKIDENIYMDNGGRGLVDYGSNLQIKFPTVDNNGVGLYYPEPKIATNGEGYFIIYTTTREIEDAEDYNNIIAKWIFTNIYADTDKIVITYTYKSDIKYTKVPTLSYSGSELFLAFDNTLMITKNAKDGENILFNLPKINNQSFVDNITNMINISTSEIALFFKNNIIICTRQSDETFGYVYTYSKTRLSLGVRLGDDVINTLDGANSIFPTIRGLAIMNYQAYMATTDQMLTFITDDIYELWTEFYKKSNAIKIIQMRNYIYLSNGTNEYLMFDTRTASWWKFKIPFAITKMLTDQLHLNIISSKLYKLDNEFNKNKYIDCDDNYIDWYIVSQRLHFGVPNHYKNLKQLIFQLVQSNNFENTINTEIKLYRKTITYKEPEMIRFKIDEFKTVVKRFNYWKINELQWALSSDNSTNIPAQLILNGIDIKYEIGEEVR